MIDTTVKRHVCARSVYYIYVLFRNIYLANNTDAPLLNDLCF